MRINKDLCVNCGMCMNRCPVSAIKKTDKVVDIDFDECVECGVCLRSNVCPKKAIYQQPLEYPRSVRSLMSDVLTIAPESGISGRGTEEMKTNEVTGRFPDGTVGIAVELGRPCYGARLYDAEKIAMAVAAEGVEFEACNPVTTMMSDPKTGKFKEELLNENTGLLPEPGHLFQGRSRRQSASHGDCQENGSLVLAQRKNQCGPGASPVSGKVRRKQQCLIHYTAWAQKRT